VRKFLKFVLVAALLTGVFFGGWSVLDKYNSAQENDEARQIAASVTAAPSATAVPAPDAPEVTAAPRKEDLTHSDPVVQELLAINLDALRAINPDVIGWVHVPDTNIDYPMVQGEDNDFYLEHTWKKVANKAGAIFLEAENATDLTDFNTIIYGHNMNNDSMFSDLINFKDQGYMDNHPSAYVVTDNGVYRYDFYSTYKASVKSITYGFKIETAKKRNELIQFSLNYAQKRTDLVPTTTDHLLTLSTCSGFGSTARWVVMGVFNREGSALITYPQ